MIVAGTAGRRDLDLGGQSRSQVVPEPEPWHPNGVRHTTHSQSVAQRTPPEGLGETGKWQRALIPGPRSSLSLSSCTLASSKMFFTSSPVHQYLLQLEMCSE